MRLAVFVQSGSLRAVPHANRAQLVDDLTTHRDARIPHSGMPASEHLAAHRANDVGERLLHVLNLPQFVFAPREVEAKHGNTELVDYGGIDLAKRLLVRNHLA